MLTTFVRSPHRRPAQALLAVAAVLLMLLVSFVQPAHADDSGGGNDCGGGVVITCGVGVGAPGSPGSGSGTPTAPGDGTPAGFTPGPQTCSYEGKDVPCSSTDGAWSNNDNCTGYVKIENPQDAPPAGSSAAVGAWYTCTTYCPANQAGGRDCYGATFWSDTPPAGIIQYTPAQAAAALVKTFQLTGINIGMAPADKVHSDDPAGTAPYRRTWVGIPVWLWVDNPQPLDYGPYSKTATLGGVTVTATASVNSITWTSGDGQTVNCGAGTAFNLAAMQNQAAQDSPTCGFRFQKTSNAGDFTVTATSHWTVQWTGGGTNGTIAVRDTSSSAPVHVGELQSVNTAGAANSDG